jgi:antitoxin StbD
MPIGLGGDLFKKSGVLIMENLLTSLTISLAELRESNKVIAKAGNQPVAILDCNELIGYFVPKGAIVNIELKPASGDQVKTFLKNNIQKIEDVLEYLKDK